MRVSRRTVLGSVATATFARAATAAPRELETGYKLVTCAAWSRDGRRFACGSLDAEIGIWDWPELRNIANLRGHSQHVRCISWNPDGKRLVSAGSDSNALIWDVATGQVQHRLLAPGGIAVWSPDGKRLATSYGNRALALWDDLAGAPTRVLLHPEQPHAAAWSPDGMRLSSAFGEQLRPPDFVGRVLLFDAATGVASPLFIVTGNAYLAPEWTSKGTGIVLQSGLKSVDIADTRTGKTIRTLKKTEISRLAVSPNGMKAALVMQGGKVRIWNLDDGQILSEFQGDPAGVTSLSWHPGSKWLALCGSNGRVEFRENSQLEL